MDPATAFQLACGAPKLIEFGVATVKAFSDIYKSKSSLDSENERLDHETRLLDTTCASVLSRLSASKQAQSSPEHVHLRGIAKDCGRLSQDLVNRLDKLKLNGPQRKRDVPGQWWKLKREKGKTGQTQTHLKRCQGLLDTQMLVQICRDLDTGNVEQSKKIREVDLGLIQSLDVFKQMNQDFQVVVASITVDILDKVKLEGEATRLLLLQNRSEAHYQSFLQSLGFPTMTARQESVDEPYPKTFN